MRKVLVVEDEARHRELLARRLRAQDFEVVLASNGNDVLDATLASQPDVILMDIDLPGMDGRSAARLLKGQAETQSIPIIAISAFDPIDERERACSAGCDDFEAKPLKLARLIDKIDKLCPA